jgi:hypothetical protein
MQCLILKKYGKNQYLKKLNSWNVTQDFESCTRMNTGSPYWIPQRSVKKKKSIVINGTVSICRVIFVTQCFSNTLVHLKVYWKYYFSLWIEIFVWKTEVDLVVYEWSNIIVKFYIRKTLPQ